MALLIKENIDLAQYSTFRMGGVARYFTEIVDQADIPEALTFARTKKIPIVILGGGSNTLFMSQTLNALVLKISIAGCVWQDDKDGQVIVTVGAGESWDAFVASSVDRGLAGIEALSLIPGTVGGTPVQNVGAYGQEVKDTIVSVFVYDTENDGFIILTNDQCQFSYRNSIFKQLPGRYIIVSVTFRLSKEDPRIPAYPGVERYFEENFINRPTLKDIRTAICAIRKTKLPDPEDIASVGSFFKNPFVSNDTAQKLKSRYPNAVLFPVDEHVTKIGAGWLIDSLGMKGQTFGNLMLYPSNALVVVNNGGATGKELKDFIVHIQKIVKETYDIELEPEPLFVE